jgi:cellulose synthase/poly-beta-1,6-N-acetylglucosamine synthase-like glycosyltransferase
MLIAVFIVCGLYLLFAIILAIGGSIKPIPASDEYKISLIIPARNEAEDLPRLLASIAQLDYPLERLQVILINHNSSDDTLKLMQDFKNKSVYNVDIVNIGYYNRDSCKAQALNAGIKVATGEVFAFTDAEAKFSPEWLKMMAGYIGSGFDLVAGPVVMGGETLFTRLQKYEWLHLCSAGAGFAGIKLPQSAFGKNMLITKALFERAGGFHEKKVWVEDLDLVSRAKKWGRIGFTLEKRCAVESLPCKNMVEFFRQRQRWFKGIKSVGWTGWLALLITFIVDLSLLIYLFINLKIMLLILALRMLGDAIILRPNFRNYGLNYGMLPLYSLFSAVYHIALVLSAPFVKDLNWR